MKIRSRAQTALWMYLPPLLLLVLLTACNIGRQDGRDWNTTPLQETVTSLAGEGEPLAQALAQSNLFAEFAFDNYPVSLIYITKDAFANYLAANGLTTEEFLMHPKLNAFLETLVIPNASIGFYDTKEGAFETVAGTTVVTSNKTFLPFAARTDMYGDQRCPCRAWPTVFSSVKS